MVTSGRLFANERLFSASNFLKIRSRYCLLWFLAQQSGASSAVMGALRLLLLLCAILRICSESPSATVSIAIWKIRTSIAASRPNSTLSLSSK